jgi:sigma-B regulation protein RsbU (phosphoserine phosphatase)
VPNRTLELQTGPHKGERYRLVKDRTVIGRHPACEIVLDASAVSRQHAVLTRQGSETVVEDLRSRNGTFVNGQQLIGKRVLFDGDELMICDQKLVFWSNSPPSADRVEIGAETGLLQGFEESDASDSKIISHVELPRHTLDEAAGPDASARLRAILGLNRAIGASLSLDEVLPRLLDGMFDIFPQADRGFVLLVDPTSKRLVLRARKLKGPPEPGPLRLSLSLMDGVVRSRRAILSADVSSDSRFSANQSVVDCRIRSVMCVPVVGAAGQSIGVLQIDSSDARQEFRKEDLAMLAGIAGQAAQAIEQALAYDERIGQEQLKRDLELAHRVQQGLLPSRPPRIEGYNVFDFYEPAQQIGGDFFGYVPLPDGRMAVVLADVSGKGVSAALVMATLSADVRYCLAMEPNVADAVARINNSFCRGGWDDRFATLVVAVLDPRVHRVTIVNAGHLPVMLRDAGGEVRPLGMEETGLPLGVEPDQTYAAIDVEIAPGASISLFTDGISEAMDHEQRTYGLERLSRVLAGPAKNAEEAGRRILGDVERHAAGQNRSDDMCLVCVGRSAERSSPA